MVSVGSWPHISPTDTFHNVLQNAPEFGIIRRLVRDDGLTLRDKNGTYMFAPAKYQASIRQRIHTDRLSQRDAHLIIPEDVEQMILIPLMVLHKISVANREIVFASTTKWAPTPAEGFCRKRESNYIYLA